MASIMAKGNSVGMIAHGTSNAALARFTKYLAEEVGPYGITVNTIFPNFVETDQTTHLPQEFVQNVLKATPLGRVAQHEDIAKVIAFFADDESSFMTGTDALVNGGLLMD